MDLEQGLRSNRNPTSISIVSFFAGVISVILVSAMGQNLAGAIVGAMGLFFGGYCMNVACRGKNVKVFMSKDMILLLISAVGLFLSILGFIFGFVYAE